MRVFKRDRSRRITNRVNFLDNEGVFVGYDFTQSCCENFGYYWSEDEPTEVVDIFNLDEYPEPPCDITDYNFDVDYFKKMEDCGLNNGGVAIFRLTNNIDDLYLVLYNCHNGYYSHGFEFRDEHDTYEEGYL